jgi:uncharacterized membrane protein (DUF485 family)
MGHGPSTEWGKDNAVKYKTRIGIILFAIYGIVYAGFIIINTVNPQLMGTKLFGGVNLAIYYGIGLIIFAIVLGIFYNFLCTRKENELNKDKPGDEK